MSKQFNIYEAQVILKDLVLAQDAIHTARQLLIKVKVNLPHDDPMMPEVDRLIGALYADTITTAKSGDGAFFNFVPLYFKLAERIKP